MTISGVDWIPACAGMTYDIGHIRRWKGYGGNVITPEVVMMTYVKPQGAGRTAVE